MSGLWRGQGQDGANEHLDDATLSAYLDREIAEATELARVEAHLAVCAACRRTLDELRAVVALLGEIEEPAPPRSFRLTPELVAAQPRPLPPLPWVIRIQPALRRVAALAAVVLVVVVTADLVTHGGGGGSTQTATTSGGEAVVAQATAAAAKSAAGTAEGSQADTHVQATSAGAAAPAAASRPIAPAASPAPAPSAAIPPGVTLPPVATPSPYSSPAPSPAPPANQPARGHLWLWRAAEVGMAIVFLLSLVAMLGLPRLWPPIRRR